MRKRFDKVQADNAHFSVSLEEAFGPGSATQSPSVKVASYQSIKNDLAVSSASLGLPLSNLQPNVTITKVIETNASSATLGFIHHFGFNFAPTGSLAAAGQQLSIVSNTALFNILGSRYGGNGTSTFGLPDLRDKLSVGYGQGPGLSNRLQGDMFGSNSIELLASNMPTKFGGAAAPFENAQSSAVTGYYITISGGYPQQNALFEPTGASSPGSVAGFTNQLIGTVWEFAGGSAPANMLPCDGRLLQISEHDALFNLIGTTFGGDGQQTFALPDLRGRTIIHAGTASGGTTYQLGQLIGAESISIQPSNLPTMMGEAGLSIDNRGPGLVLNYIVALQGIFPSQSGAMEDPSIISAFGGESTPFLGELVAFAGNFAPRGYALASGQLLPINQNQALFSLFGTTYGGNGQTNFALPDLRGRALVSGGYNNIGTVRGSETLSLTTDSIPDLNYFGTALGETLYGGDGDDIIDALGGNDTIIGNGGNDILTGGAGDDTVNGSLGTDTASYSTAPSGVVVDLDIASAQNTGGAGVDTLVSIENLTGSAFGDTLRGTETGNNVLRGEAGNDFLYGRGGDDTLFGGAGNDLLDGGTGSDTADYSDASAGVWLNLSNTSAQNTVGAGTDTLIGIEHINGSNYDDFLTGNAQANYLRGGGGNDQLNGAGGLDTLEGGSGNDRYIVNTAGVTVLEFSGGGTDQIQTSLSTYTLPANVEVLRFTGWGTFTAYGNAGAESFYYAGDLDEANSSRFYVYAGGGNDSIYGNDWLNSNHLYGEAGDDIIIYSGNELTSNDVNDGGAGTDTLLLGGPFYNAGMTVLGLASFQNFEVLAFQAGDDYSIGLLDGHTAAGRNMIIDGKLLGAGDNLTFDGSAETDGSFLIYAGRGVDHLAGGANNDGFYFGGALDAGDFVDGGAGNDDQVGLQGDYSGGLVLNAAKFPGVETLSILPGNITAYGDPGTNFYDYNLTTSGSFGISLIVNANRLRAGEDLTFNGSAETSGSFFFYGGQGVETLTGGANNDAFYFGADGRFGAGDTVNGGGGSDNQLGLRGDYSVDFTAAGFTGALTNIQTISLLSDMDSMFTPIGDGEFDYYLILNDSHVGAGQQMTVTGVRLGATETMVVDGSLETNGTLRLIGGAAADTLVGGAGADIIFGGLGADTMAGNGGADQFIYTSAAQSTAAARDSIFDFAPNADKLNLTGIDADSIAAGDQAFAFIGSAAFSNTAGQLRAYLSDAGANIWQVEGDVNGDGAADFAVQLSVLAGQSVTAGDILL